MAAWVVSCGLASLLVLGGLPAATASQSAPEAAAVPVDMTTGWYRRDWDGCDDPSEMSLVEGAMNLRTESSAVMYWQVPMRSGRPLALNADQKWIRECDRPPRDFGKTIRRGLQEEDFLDASELRFLSWRWRIEGTVDDSDTVDDKGKIRSQGDDFAAKLGVSILSRGSENLREVSYVWTRTLPEDALLFQETKVLFFRARYYRIVAESGEAHAGDWVEESVDLHADFKRAYPDEEPGTIVRVYLMSDSDDTGSRTAASFAGLRFSRD